VVVVVVVVVDVALAALLCSCCLSHVVQGKDATTTTLAITSPQLQIHSHLFLGEDIFWVLSTAQHMMLLLLLSSSPLNLLTAPHLT
jgi:hypothetical protein